MAKSKTDPRTDSQGNPPKPLAVPDYTREQLIGYSISTLELLKERHEKAGLMDTALTCLELIEEKKLQEQIIKPKRQRKINGESNSTHKPKPPRIRPKNSTAISWHFQDIAAPLHNTVWSWGATSEQRREVILRVWSDEIKLMEDERLVQLTLHSRFAGGKNPGYHERLRHIELIKSNHKGYAIICEPVDKNSTPRKIKSYDRERLYPISRIVEINGDDWGVLGREILISHYIS
jgi:hypothetical protein